MVAEPDPDGELTPSSQDALARSLIDCLGRDGAIHVCKANGWQGVLKRIECQDDLDPEDQSA